MDNPYQSSPSDDSDNRDTASLKPSTAKIQFQRVLFIFACVVLVRHFTSSILRRSDTNGAGNPSETAFNELIANAGYGWLVIGFVLLALSIWTYFQLYEFGRMAREFAILITVLGILPIGPSIVIEVPIEPMIVQQLEYVETILWGGVIVMSYCTPYTDLFQSNAG